MTNTELDGTIFVCKCKCGTEIEFVYPHKMVAHCPVCWREHKIELAKDALVWTHEKEGMAY